MITTFPVPAGAESPQFTSDPPQPKSSISGAANPAPQEPAWRQKSLMHRNIPLSPRATATQCSQAFGCQTAQAGLFGWLALLLTAYSIAELRTGLSSVPAFSSLYSSVALPGGPSVTHKCHLPFCKALYQWTGGICTPEGARKVTTQCQRACGHLQHADAILQWITRLEHLTLTL